jgi:CRISPR-associated protein Csa5
MSERTEFINISIENIAKVLALLATQGNYTYIDKMGYVPSKDLFISFEYTNHV